MPRYSAKSRSYYAQRAMERRLLNRVRHPIADQARVYIPRGSQLAQQLGVGVGLSYKDASPEQQAIRRALGWRGRGGFFGGVAGLLSGKGWKAGSDFGDKLWASGGQQLAGFVPGLSTAVSYGDQVAPVAQQLASMAGRGAYAKQNSLIMNPNVSDVVPDFAPTDIHTVRFTNKEFIQDIYAPAVNTPFSTLRWSLNPGIESTFPWLSQLGINFVDYEIEQLIFTYKSTVAEFAAASGQVGQIVMATQYNPSEAPFQTKEEMMLYQGAMSCKTTESMLHGVECDPAKNAGSANKLIRFGNVGVTEDLKNFDLGTLNLAVINAPSTYTGQILGELWVSYTVVLRKPRLAAALGYGIPRSVFVCKGASAAVPFGLNGYSGFGVGSQNSLPVTYIPPPSTTSTITQYTLNGVQVGPDNLYAVGAPFVVTNQQCGATFRLAPNWSGILRVRIVTKHNQNFNAVNLMGLYSSNYTTISRYADLPLTSALNTVGWDHKIVSRDQAAPEQTNDSTPSGQTQYDSEYHLRVLPAVGGIPNELYLSLSNTTAPTECVSFIEFMGYNTSLSIDDSGSVPQLALQTVNNQPYQYA